MENNKDILKILVEILKWIKIGNMKEVKNLLQEALSDDDKKLIYHYSDGSRGVLNFNDISQKGKTSIARYWKEWYKVGLVEMIDVKGGNRAKKLFELEDFGISIPETPKSKVVTNSDIEKENLNLKELDKNE